MLTPNWKWHDHNNHGAEPMVWFDGLDLPLVATLESIFFENHPDRSQPVLGHNLSEELYTGVGLVDPNAERDRLTLAAPALSWADTERALDSLHRAHGGPIGHGRVPQPASPVAPRSARSPAR